MVELLSTMTLTEVILIIFAILVALKEAISLVEFFFSRINKKFNKGYEEKDTEKKILVKLELLEEDSKQRIKDKQELSKQILEIKEYVTEKLNIQEDKLQKLTDSDRDDIKSWIVQQYHYFTKVGEIDDFSMDTIMRRYKHYQDEGGNSYVESLIEKLQDLQIK